MHLRLASPADVPMLMALANDSPEAAHWSNAQYAELFTGPPRTVLVAHDDTEIHGFLVARASTNDWELENIVVAAPHRRCGLGTRLLNALLESARDAHVSSIFLEVRESNRAARGFYERNKFVESGRRRAYYNSPSEDAILYRFDLPIST